MVYVSLLQLKFINLSLPRAYQLFYLESLHIFEVFVCIFNCKYICEFALGYVFFIYPMTVVHMFNGSSEYYATLLLAPAEG